MINLVNDVYFVRDVHPGLANGGLALSVKTLRKSFEVLLKYVQKIRLHKLQLKLSPKRSNLLPPLAWDELNEGWQSKSPREVHCLHWKLCLCVPIVDPRILP